MPAAQILPEHHPDSWHSPMAAARSVQVEIQLPHLRRPPAPRGYELRVHARRGAFLPALIPSPPLRTDGAGRSRQETEGWPSSPAHPFPGNQDPSDHIQKPLAPDFIASQNGYWSLIPALAVSSCSWDRHPGDNLGKTAAREHQHKAGVCGDPRGRSVLQSAPHPRTRQPAPSSWAAAPAPVRPPRLSKRSRRDELPLARPERKEKKATEARPGCKTLGHHCRQ